MRFFHITPGILPLAKQDLFRAAFRPRLGASLNCVRPQMAVWHPLPQEDKVRRPLAEDNPFFRKHDNIY